MANTTTAIALNYGYNWITGYRLNYRTLQNTGIDTLDYTRVGMWALGAGEMDGCEELWDAGLQRLLFTSEHDDTTKFRFHSGTDAVIGEGSYPSSTGGDQSVDAFWTYLPPGVQPLHYNRIAYYSLFLKQLINNPPEGTPDQTKAELWTDLNPVGLWRGLRCRLFDATGAMIGYGFTTNPAWQYVDVVCRRKLFPEYNISIAYGADDLPIPVRNRFDWGAIFAAANLFDTITNGVRMFEGNFSFSDQTTLQAIRSQILTSCRSYDRERGGKLGIYTDQVRASVFTLSRKNAWNFEANDQPLSSAANRYIAAFRDIMVPKAADIASITTPDHGDPQVGTLAPHPFATDDRVVIGGTNSKYDGTWKVKSVPAGDSVTTLTLYTKGSNYPDSIGSGGAMGLSYSRFKQRAPEFNHHAHQYAKGAAGVEIPRQRNKVKLQNDLSNTTYDQASRISQYQMFRTLGPDVRPYISPVNATVDLSPWSEDAAGSEHIAIGIEPGDRVIVDDTLSPEYAGDYEVLQVDLQPDTATQRDGSMQASPVAGSMSLTLGPYIPAALTATSNQLQAGWDVVPGSTPGNSAEYTTIPLADGIAVFFTGSAGDGDTVSIPSLGFSPDNVLLWASPQGFIDENNAQLHFINNCSVDQVTRKLAMIYDNGNGRTWRGDLNFAGLAWRSQESATVTTSGEFKFVELTLLGGEKICFGQGHLAASASFPMPSGYSAANSVRLCFPHSSSDTGNNAHGVRSYVDTSGIAHHDYYDGESHHWEGDSYGFFCGYRNNMGTVTGGLNTYPGWAYIPVGPQRLVLGGFRVVDSRVSSPAISNPPTTSLPVTTGTAPAPTSVTTNTLQCIFTPDGFQIVDHPTHGVAACLMDANLNVFTMFEDGEGTTWFGSSSGFCLVCDTPSEF